MSEPKLKWSNELNTGTTPSNNDPRKQVVYLRTEKNHLTILLRDRDKEIKRMREALEEIERRGPHQHFEYYHLAQEALK
jgi:hypothetical protein